MSSSPTPSTAPSPSPSPSRRSNDYESLCNPLQWEAERSRLLLELGVQARMLERRRAQLGMSEEGKAGAGGQAEIKIETMTAIQSYEEAYRILGLDPWSQWEETTRVIEDLYLNLSYELDPKTTGAMFFVLASAGKVQDPHLAAILAALHARELEVHSAKIYQAFNINLLPDEATAESERATSPEPLDNSSSTRSVQDRGTQTEQQREGESPHLRSLARHEDLVVETGIHEELRRNAQNSEALLHAVHGIKDAIQAGGGHIRDNLEHLEAAVRRATRASNELMPTRQDTDWQQKYEEFAHRVIPALEERDAHILKLEEALQGMRDATMSKASDSRKARAEARVAQSMVESLTCQRDAQTLAAAESDRRIKSLEAEARSTKIEAYNKEVEIFRLRGQIEADRSSSSNRTEGSSSEDQEALKGLVVSQSDAISRLESQLDSQKCSLLSADLLKGLTVESEVTAAHLRARVALLETSLATANDEATYWHSEHDKRGEWLASVAGPRMQEEKAKVAALLDENLKLKHALAGLSLSHAAALPAAASLTTLTPPGLNGIDQFLRDTFSR